MREFNGKTVIITGSNRGIGNESLNLFAQEGANIFAVSRTVDDAFSRFCKKKSEEYAVNIIPVQMDLGDETSIREGYQYIIRESKQIDILINNAGIVRKQSLLTMTKMEDIRNVFQINFFSQVLLTQLVSRSMMKAKKGSIVCVSSSAAFDGGTNVEYSASKAAIIGMVRRLSKELSNYNIRINAVAPGLTLTDMANTLSDKDINIVKNMNAMHRLGQKTEIANAIVFLASEKSSFITGQVIRVDGGL